MTSHELARALLAEEDLPVCVTATHAGGWANGLRKVSIVELDTGRRVAFDEGDYTVTNEPEDERVLEGRVVIKNQEGV